MSVDQAIEAEAQAQAICMQTGDFRRAYEALRRQGRAAFRGELTSPVHAMPDESFLTWPFFEPRHREHARQLDRWAADALAGGRPSRARRGVPDAGGRARP